MKLFCQKCKHNSYAEYATAYKFYLSHFMAITSTWYAQASYFCFKILQYDWPKDLHCKSITVYFFFLSKYLTSLMPWVELKFDQEYSFKGEFFLTLILCLQMLFLGGWSNAHPKTSLYHSSSYAELQEPNQTVRGLSNARLAQALWENRR